MADDRPATAPPDLSATVLPAEQIAYSAVGPDGTSVTGFGSGHPVLVTAADGRALDASHAQAAFALATAACEAAGFGAPDPEAYTPDPATGGLRFRRCG